MEQATNRLHALSRRLRRVVLQHARTLLHQLEEVSRLLVHLHGAVVLVEEHHGQALEQLRLYELLRETPHRFGQ